MLELPRRALYSKKLQHFVEEQRKEERNNFKKSLINFWEIGRIDFCGPTSVLGDNGGAILRLTVMLQKSEFSEPEEIVSDVRKEFGEMWQPFFDQLLSQSSIENLKATNIDEDIAKVPDEKLIIDGLPQKEKIAMSANALGTVSSLRMGKRVDSNIDVID